MLATMMLIEGIPSGIVGGIEGITSELQAANDAMYEFAGAREEMFYGFAAGNVTGDLVKQVKKTGVENLVVNTEVIMTNNFNGMTTDQVANEILMALQRRAGSTSGITFT
jgi:hypothetical protein